jgi:hypothetical protein
VNASINIAKLEEFDAAFGKLGAKGGSRTGPNRRTQDEEEWYIVRRFLKEAIAAEIFQLPLTIQKSHPPEPDFAVEYSGRALIEITEATNEADQREMTRLELSDKPILLGELGGRFEGGGGEPGHLWSSDIVEAIERKERKSIFSTASVDRHLVVYPNSNASFLIFDEEDELRAFSILLNLIDTKRSKLSQIANGCLVHILSKEHVFFDILGEARRRRRS